LIPSNEGRLIAIGDIHGCISPLRVILKSIDPQPDDVFVFLGDFVDRGPDSKGVIDEVISLSDKCTVYTICGNHEEMILAAFQGGQFEHKYWCKFGGKEALASYGVNSAKELPGRHLRFIADCKDYIESDDFIFVHATYDPEVPLSNEGGSVLRWNKLDKTVAPHPSGKTVVCGHTAQKQVLDLGHLLCIDTGCGVWVGGRLTAMDVKSGKIWQANANSKRATIKQREGLNNGSQEI
jgi:serine/threonine protein phosphatase 1